MGVFTWAACIFSPFCHKTKFCSVFCRNLHYMLMFISELIMFMSALTMSNNVDVMHIHESCDIHMNFIMFVCANMFMGALIYGLWTHLFVSWLYIYGLYIGTPIQRCLFISALLWNKFLLVCQMVLHCIATDYCFQCTDKCLLMWQYMFIGDF